MAECKVFYSWQSDLPNSTNRGFIQKALEDAVKYIHNDDSIEIEPVVDRDTLGIPGSPDIVSTIFAKIEQAYIFVCDISIINTASDSRLTPNPNVLIELGYALKVLGSERIVMVMNTAFGMPEHLPFDLRMRRVITYEMPEGLTEKALERKQLREKLQVTLNTILIGKISQTVGELIQPLSIAEQAKIAVEKGEPNQEALTRKFMNHLVTQLDSLAPDFKKKVSDQMVVDAIEQTIELGVEFAHLAEAIAVMKASKAAIVMYKGFEEVINRYDTPIGFSGTCYKWSFDFYKFVGQEFFVILLSFLIREEQWEIIVDILDEELYINNLYGTSQSATVPFTYISSYLESLYYREQRLNLTRGLMHSKLLKNRHTQGNLAEVVPMQQFIDADCFLLLRDALQASEKNSLFNWQAWSLIYIQQPPRYLTAAYRVKNVQKLLVPLKMASVEIFRNRMIEITHKLSQAFGYDASLRFHNYPLGDFDPHAIGSRQ